MPSSSSFGPIPTSAARVALYLLIACLRIGVLQPKCLEGLVGEDIVPMVGTGAADILQRSLQIIWIVGNHRRWHGLLRSLFSGHRCVLGRLQHMAPRCKWLPTIRQASPT